MTRQDARVCAAFECLALDLVEFQDTVRRANEAVNLFNMAVADEAGRRVKSSNGEVPCPSNERS